MQYLVPKDLIFSMNENGILSLEYEGKTISPAQVTRLFPFQDMSRFLSVSDGETEIGLIEMLDSFGKEQRQIIENYLNYKYFIPEIKKITKVEEKLGYVYMDIGTVLGDKTICIADVTSNVRQVRENFISVIDVQGNRYFIPGVAGLDKKTRQKIELYI